MIPLDKSEIPPEKRNDPRLAEWEEAVSKGIQNTSYRVGVCLHEAAHAIYLERCGACCVTLHVAVALYDAQSDRYEASVAAVRPSFGKERALVDLDELARAYAAGGVAKRLLIADDTWMEEGGDQTDFRIFAAEASKSGLPVEEISRRWEQAKRDVEKDLRSPALRLQIWDRAREFEKQILRHAADR